MAPADLAELPETLHVADTGRTVRREDLDGLPSDELRRLWYEHHYTTPDGAEHTAAKWPFRGDNFFFADAGPLPMPLAELAGLGLTDEQLFAEHAAYYREPAVMPHPHGDLDSPEAQRLRRKVFDEVTAAWYADPPMPRLHGG
jgi:hypothetical protein